MGTEPSVFGRFEGYGSPVEITRGGYVMVKVHYQDEAWQLIETLIKAFPGLPKRGGHMLRDGLGNTEFVRPTYHGSHIVNGREYAVRRNEYDQLVCDGPYCPVCRPTETRTE